MGNVVMPTMGIDTESAALNYAEVKARGYTFVMRYIVPSIPGKLITKSEIAAIHAQQLDLGMVYETTGTTFRMGQKGGLTDGQAARGAMIRLGAPRSCAAYHAIDSQVSASDMPSLIEWAKAVRGAMLPYSTGFYGPFNALSVIKQNLSGVYTWQTSAWSDGQWLSGADMRQQGTVVIGGIDCDVDKILFPDWGQWHWLPTIQPEPKGEALMFSGTVNSNAAVPIPVPAHSVTQVALYCDFVNGASDEQQIRVALHSQSKGYNQIEVVSITSNSPVSLHFTESDVDGVSFRRDPGMGMAEIGYLIS